MSAYDRAVGAIFGLAAGDRIGGPVQMACVLAAALCEKGDFEATAVRAGYLAWWRASGFDTGPVGARVFSALSSGLSPEAAVAKAHRESRQLTAGCNPLHRSVPLAAAAFIGGDRVAELSRREAALTHFDPLAGDVAALQNRLVRALIEGVPFADALDAVLDGRPEFRAEVRGDLERDGFAPHVLAAAVYFVNTSDDFKSALDRAIRFAGPANYCPVVTGTIGGARWGFSTIPADYYRHSPVLKRLPELSRRLASGFGTER